MALSSAQLVAYPNGAVTPVDTPEVYAAKLAHAAAGGAVHHAYATGYPYHAGYHFGGLVGHANGAVVPVDTAEVHAAKVAHAAAGGAVHAPEVAPYAYGFAGYPYGYAGHAAYPYAGAYGYAGYAGVPVHAGFAGLVAHPNGAIVPLEPADVVNARAEHLAAVASA